MLSLVNSWLKKAALEAQEYVRLTGATLAGVVTPPVYRHDIDLIQCALASEVGDKQRVDRRNAAQDPRQTGDLRRNGLAGQSRHTGKPFPIRIEL